MARRGIIRLWATRRAAGCSAVAAVLPNSKTQKCRTYLQTMMAPARSKRRIGSSLARCLVLSSSAHAFILDGNNVLLPSSSRVRGSATSSSSLHNNNNGRIVIADDVAPDRNVQAMQQWAYQCGIQTSDGLDLLGSETDTTRSTGIDYSIITNTDLPAGSPLMYAPAEVVLSSTKAGQ